MKSLSGASIVLILQVSLCVPTHLSAASNKVVAQDHAVPSTAAVWQSTKAEHAYALPDIKHNKKGTLTLSADALTSTGKSGNTSIPRSSVTAVSAGNQRVELWGMGGRILRMAIPDGGGVAAAAVMHHRVDMLTVEFNDSSSGYHAAVFFLPAKEADRALQNFVLTLARLGKFRTLPARTPRLNRRAFSCLLPTGIKLGCRLPIERSYTST